MEEAVDDCVDVFVGGNRLLTAGQAGGHRVEPGAHRFAFGAGKDPSLGERERPAFGELDIEGPEAKVDRDGAVDCFEGRMGTAGKAAAPEFVGSAVGGAGFSLLGGHRIP